MQLFLVKMIDFIFRYLTSVVFEVRNVYFNKNRDEVAKCEIYRNNQELHIIFTLATMYIYR